jgi:hypothetical protein
MKAALDSNGTIHQSQAIALVTSNLERALGLAQRNYMPDLVMYEGGGIFDFTSKVVGVVSMEREIVELF